MMTRREAQRTTMPMIGLSPLTDRSRQTGNFGGGTFDNPRQLFDKNMGGDHRMIPSGDTVFPQYHINDPFKDSIEQWDRTGVGGKNRKVWVIYLANGKTIIKDCSPRELFVFLRKNKLSYTLIAAEPAVLSSTSDGMRKTAAGKGFLSLVSTVLAASFKVESQNVKRGVKEIGSGFYIKDNFILTCAHVISRAEETDFSDIMVYVIDAGHPYAARVIDVDYELDIALLYCDSTKHISLPPGSIEAAQVGEELICVGSPYGYDNNVTKGILSSKDRKIHSGEIPYFFMDLAVYPGSSGGPVVSIENGHVLGIAAVIVESVGNYGLNAAIPIEVCLERFSSQLS